MKHLIYTVTGALLFAAMSAAAMAADTEARHWHELDSSFRDQFRNPAEGVELGLDLRLREVYARNIFGLDSRFGDPNGNWNDNHWQRFRARLAATVSLDADVTANTRLTWEFWNHCKPDDTPPGPLGFFAEKNTDFDEAIIDILNVQFRNAFDMPLTMTVGRQEIILGTGWLILEGTPGDGSRTIFFDAIRATYDVTSASKLDMIYIQQYDDASKWLKPINHGAVADRRHLTQNQDERGLILYYTNNDNPDWGYDAYYIYKNARRSSWAKFYNVAGSDADIHTVGGRLFGNLDTNWSYTAELAKQWGNRDDNSMRGLGANTKLTYAFNDEQKSRVFCGYEYLSGDDPSTSSSEKFDTLWGDWSQSQRGGDLQSYMWAAEGALGEVANLHRLGAGHSFMPAPEWTILSQYNLLWADENPGGVWPYPSPQFSNSGNFRGHMFSGLITYRCCSNFSTHFMLDYFFPGGYYDKNTNDPAFFARVCVEWTF
ncbi:MAG TPA: alginate export family protein [Sedimentisphaerales bacterium]|nr:alginate export family protein [Sedimentisphaerales bacterium]